MRPSASMATREWVAVSWPRGQTSVSRARPRSPEGAGHVEAVQRVEVEVGGGEPAAGALGGEAEAAELGPCLDRGREDRVAVAGRGGVLAQGVGPDLGLLYVPAARQPSGGAQGGVDGDGEAGGGGAVGVHLPFVRRGFVGGSPMVLGWCVGGAWVVRVRAGEGPGFRRTRWLAVPERFRVFRRDFRGRGSWPGGCPVGPGGVVRLSCPVPGPRRGRRSGR